MHPSKITRILRISGFVLAVFIAGALPLTYGIMSFNGLESKLADRAQQSAGRAARYIFSNERMWEFQRIRLHEVIELTRSDQLVFHQKIVSDKGIDVYSDTNGIAWPVLTRRAPIFVSGRSVGELVVTTSMREMAIGILGMSVISLVLATLTLAMVHKWPIRLINNALADLVAEQQRARESLEQKLASEQKLLAQGKELADVQRVARLGGWSMNPDGAELVASAQTLEVLGISGEPTQGFMQGLLRHAVDDSAAHFRSQIRRTIKTLEISSLNCQFRRPDGRIIDLHLRLWPSEVEGHWVKRISGTLQDVTASKEAERQLEKLAYFDPLTGLANRALFKRELNDEVERLKRSGGGSVLLLLDLDRFKEVNDSLGHAAGDELLKRVAQLLRRLVPQDAFIARLGGDEFAIILHKHCNPEAVSDIAQGIVDAIEKPVPLGRSEAKIGTSIGIVQLLKDADDAETLVKYADLALYQAKDRGRGRYNFFTHELDELIQHKVMLARDLRQAAAENNGLEVWFQPIMSLNTRRIHGFEALMRWKHPTLGYIPPLEFIPIAESSSLISDLGNWIMRETAHTAKAWIDAGGTAYEVSVNLSPAQIWQSDLEAEVAAILQETGLPPHLLCLELTESLFVDHAEIRVRQVLNGLKSLGVSLALDDFGTGFSSLAYLTQLPFDKLKVDRAFVQNAPFSAKGRHVLEGIIALGHGLGMSVVAEGIENEDELAILEAAHCDLIQGYLLARPKPAAEALLDGAGLVHKLQDTLTTLRGIKAPKNNVAA